MNLTPEKENQILTALAAKVAGTIGADNVISDEPQIDSKHDFIEELTVQNADSEIETKYIKIDYLGWRDSLTDGCDDNPVTFLKYKIHCFQEYKPKRADDSAPAGDMKLLDLNLRARFLETENNARVLIQNCESAPLVPVSDMILDDDALTGVYGYSRDFTVEVECV